MLTVEEIKMFIDEDAASVKKHFARVGERYFDGDHDIKNYRMFYFNSDGQLVEDTSRANVRIPHPFFKELTEQGTQYTLSGSDGFVFSDVPELQSELDARFNNNDDFIDELSETLTDCQTKGFAYMYAMKDSTDKLKFTCADSIGVVEVEARFAEDGKDHVIYWYVDRVDKEGHRIKKIMDWDDEQVVYYVQTDEGEIQLDDKAKVNPRPHILYQVDGDDNTYIDSLGFLPFFRLDNNKKQISNLKAVKDLIDDYDLMASSLSNNLIDFDHPLYAVKGFEGDNLDELQQNLKTKKIVGVGSDGGIEVHTVDVPYEARRVKLELDEKNIYRFGMGLNLSGLPNIFILFLALAFLEDSGYMARVAYVMEGIMSKLGLSGRAFIPMILGFGCTVPAIMASRSLENRRDRFKVMLITPFMSCSARLPIYILFAEMFFQERAMLVAYSMYLIGLVVAILVAAIIHLIDRRKSENYLLIELPEYKAPSARTVAIYVWEKVKDYLTKAGTTIFVASILMWVILNFGPHGYTTEMADSFGSILGHWLVPIFAPIGLGFWQIAVALIAGISAKEVVVSSCAVLFGIPNINSGAGMDTLVGILGAAGFGQLNAFCLMIFCLLYVPCAAALATIRKESGSTRWMLFSALFQLVVAWAVTFVVYRVGLLL